MRYVDGVKIVLKDPGFPQSTEVFVSNTDGKEVEIMRTLLVHWPIDIHIDEKGAWATLRVRVESLEIKGIAVIEEPPDEANGLSETELRRMARPSENSSRQEGPAAEVGSREGRSPAL